MHESQVLNKIKINNVEPGIALSIYEPLEIIDSFLESK